MTNDDIDDLITDAKLAFERGMSTYSRNDLLKRLETRLVDELTPAEAVAKLDAMLAAGVIEPNGTGYGMTMLARE